MKMQSQVETVFDGDLRYVLVKHLSLSRMNNPRLVGARETPRVHAERWAIRDSPRYAERSRPYRGRSIYLSLDNDASSRYPGFKSGEGEHATEPKYAVR